MSEALPPTREWKHSHALKTGDIVVDDFGSHVIEVHEDGSVTWDGETFEEREVTAALRDGVIARNDGLTHELATF